MKGGIDIEGALFIERGGDDKFQSCPWASDLAVQGEQNQCRDFCPHFGEPEREGDVVFLSLCHGTKLKFQQFQDYRNRNSKC